MNTSRPTRRVRRQTALIDDTRLRRYRVLTLLLVWALGQGAVTGAEPQTSDAAQIAETRAQLARQKAALVAAEALLREAQNHPNPTERAEALPLAENTVAKQRQAVQNLQARLDTLLGCTEARQQVDRDRRVVESTQASVAAVSQALQEWTQQNEDAQRQAVQVATHALADGILGKFLESTEARLARGEAELRSLPANRVDPLFLADLKALRQQVNGLKLRRDLLKLTQAGKSAVELWNTVAEAAADSQHGAAEIGTLLRKLGANKLVLKSLEQGALLAATSQFERRLIDAKFPLIRDAAKLGNFLVDYGYEATRWVHSRRRILEASALSEQQLEAVAAVGCQLERSMVRLQTCRGERVSVLSARCQAVKP